MTYNPTNRSYQYMLLQNRAYHEQALRNPRSTVLETAFGPSTPLNDQSMTTNQKKSRRKKSKSRGRSKDSNMSTINMSRLPSAGGTGQRKEGDRIWAENMRLVHKLIDVKPTVEVRKDWKRRNNENEQYKRSISAFNQQSKLPRTITMEMPQHEKAYQLKAVAQYLAVHRPLSQSGTRKMTPGCKGAPSVRGPFMTIDTSVLSGETQENYERYLATEVQESSIREEIITTDTDRRPPSDVRNLPKMVLKTPKEILLSQ